MNWKDEWENQTAATRDFISTLSEDEILGYIKEGKSDMFYQVWHVIGEKGTLEKSTLILWEYLKKHPLHWAIVGPNSNKGEKARQKALAEIKTLIEQGSYDFLV